MRGYADRNYGVVEGGVSGSASDRLSVQINGRADIARSTGQDYSLTAGLKLAL